MPEIHIIAAVARNGAIGRRGDLLFHISADLRRFKSLTMGCPIIMGRKTFESFPKGALPGRRNIVVTRDSGYSRPGIETAGSIREAVAMCDGVDTGRIYIIGGGEIYRQSIHLADVLDLTEIDTDVTDADTFFPPVPPGAWTETESTPYVVATDTTPPYRFTTFRRVRTQDQSL